jgi:hypothetical protein
MGRVLIVEDVTIIALDPCLRLTPVGSMVVGDLTLGREACPHIWPPAPIRPSVLLFEIDRRGTGDLMAWRPIPPHAASRRILVDGVMGMVLTWQIMI